MKDHLTPEQIANLLLEEKCPSEQLHLRECEICRTEVNRLRDAFSLYRDATRNWSDHWMTVPPAQPASACSSSVGSWAVGGVVSVIALAAAFLVLSSDPPLPAEQPFVSIPYVVPATSDERTRIMRMSVPVAALRSAGFSIPLHDVGASVRADVLVGQDGRPLAVRLLDRRYDQ
jgi:hypothetical protein